MSKAPNAHPAPAAQRIGGDDLEYIMETFPIVKRKDEAKYGDYRTKLQILEIYDRMREAIAPRVGPTKPSSSHPRLTRLSLMLSADDKS